MVSLLNVTFFLVLLNLHIFLTVEGLMGGGELFLIMFQILLDGLKFLWIIMWIILFRW